MTTKDFDLGDVLSVTSGKLVSPRHMDAIYDILNWMTGDNLFTHQLPRAMQECRAPLLAQHPQLAEVQTPDDFGGSESVVMTWLAEQKARFGPTLAVVPLGVGQHVQLDPIEELCDMVGSEKVFVATLPGNSGEV